MQQLGHSRSIRRLDHILHTPDAFVRAPLPGMRQTTAIVHVSPAAGAKFTQYTAEFEPGGLLGSTLLQRFVYVLEGELETRSVLLKPGGFAYFPSGDGSPVSAKSACRAIVIEKPYLPLDGAGLPHFFTGDESTMESLPLGGDSDLRVRCMIPDDPSFDMAVNTMTYQPGAALSMVEVHVMEHGLLFVAGGGVYRLGEHWYPVTTGDFIYMAPYCPQWFGALGKTPAKYVIYKDWNRAAL